MVNNMYPDNIIGFLFRLLDSMTTVCDVFVETMSRTPRDVFTEWLGYSELPLAIKRALEYILENSKFIDYSYFDMLVGSFLMLILTIGIIKFFTDLVGL